MVEPAEEFIELSILMPCLNEAETLEICIQKAMRFLQDSGINGEVLIADNGSTDGSVDIAFKNGARVVSVQAKGYGAALTGGSNAARGKFVIMGDADDSYDFLHLQEFVDKLRQGYDLVMGNRFMGGIEKGAMPPLHRYLGNPLLSFIGRLFFPSKIRDFHCGLRGYRTESIRKLNLHTTGMEYASEMVVQATLHHLKMIEVPTRLYRDGRSRAPHLRSWSDGWRHLKFLLVHSPDWLFLYPGLLLLGLGFLLMAVLSIGPLRIMSVTFDIHTLLYSAIMMITGMQFVLFSIFTKTYAVNSGFIPVKKPGRFVSKLTPNKGVFAGFVMLLLGIAITVVAFVLWGRSDFKDLQPQTMMRITIPSLVFICTGVQLILGSFFIEILNIKMRR